MAFIRAITNGGEGVRFLMSNFLGECFMHFQLAPYQAYLNAYMVVLGSNKIGEFMGEPLTLDDIKWCYITSRINKNMKLDPTGTKNFFVMGIPTTNEKFSGNTIIIQGAWRPTNAAIIVPTTLVAEKPKGALVLLTRSA